MKSGSEQETGAADRPSTVPELVAHVAQRFGDHVLATGVGKTLTYRQMEEESAELARGLLAAGVGKGTRVGLLMPNSSDWVVGWLAALRIGALATGISTFLKPPELAWVLRFADIDTLLVADRYLSHDYVRNLGAALPSLGSQLGTQPLALPESPFLRSIWLFGEGSPAWIRGHREDLQALGGAEPFGDGELLAAIESEVTPSDLSIVIFTSGSLANPKGVVHSHGTLVRHAQAMVPYGNCREGERVGVLSPLFWIGGMLTTLLNTMIAGGTLVFPERPDPASVLALIRDEGLDYLNAWVGQLKAVTEHPDFRPEDFLALKPAHGAQARADVLGAPLTQPRDLVSDSLGMSETFGPHSGELADTLLPEERAGSFGRVIGGPESGIERKILHRERSEELPFGSVGELAVRGYSVMQGYYKRERDETFEADGFFRTGDLCSITEDGYLFFEGRGGEMIKTRGANVSPREVEVALEALPEVVEAIVLGKPDPSMGEMVVALVVPKSRDAFSEAGLRERLDESLSSYKIPKRIGRISSENLPRTSSGKVQKFKLLEDIETLLDTPKA